MARADAAGLIKKYRGRREIYAEGWDAFDEVYDAYLLLCASYDDLLAERYRERGA